MPDLGQGPGGVGAPAGGDQRNNNEAMARFMHYDTNRDGKLSPNEVPHKCEPMLQDADLNATASSTPAEFQMFSRKMGERMKAFSAGVNPNGAAAATATDAQAVATTLRCGDSSHLSISDLAIGGIRFARILPSRGGVVPTP